MVERVSRRRFIGCSVGSALAAAVATETFEGFVPPQYGLQQLFPNNPLELLKKYQDSQRKAEEKEQEALRLTKEKQNLVDQLSKTETSKKELLIRIAETEDIYKQAISEMESYRKNANNALNLLMKLFSDNKEKLGAGAEYGIKSVEVIRDQASRSSSLQVQLTVLTNQLDDISSFSSKVSDFLNQYNEDPLASLAGVNSVVTEFRSKIGRTITQPIESSVSIISSQKAQINSFNKRFEAPEPVKVDSRIETSAYYFTYWLPSSRDFGNWAVCLDKPMLGPYLSDNPTVADWHIYWALGSGIDNFTVLYGDKSWDSAKALEKGLMQSKYFDMINVSVMFGLWPWMPNNQYNFDPIDALKVIEDSTKYLADKLFGRPNQLRVDGTPIYEIGYLWNWTNAVGADKGVQLIRTARRAAKDKGFDLYIIGDIMTTNHDSPINSILMSELDAITNFGMINAGGNWVYQGDKAVLRYPYEEYVIGLLRETEYWHNAANDFGIDLQPSILAGLTNRGLYERGLVNYLIEFTSFTPDKLRVGCEGIGAHVTPKLNRVSISQFNGFDEGSFIEPSLSSGFSRIAVVRNTYTVKPASGWPADLIPGQLF
jgi:hypothetical protein